MKFLEIPMKDVPINGHTSVFDFRRHESPEMFIVFMIYKEIGLRLYYDDVSVFFDGKTDKMFFVLDGGVAAGIVKYYYDDKAVTVAKFA